MEGSQRGPSLLATLGVAGILAVVLVVGVYGLTHVSISVISPRQSAPRKHFAARCGMCHDVSEGAPLVQAD